ncbi:hypothetical protein HK101_002229 [Irineochytrium annulatum]|nr:hypothetical protein HK101_002229 [Irineochytrium annulatum]
MIPSFLILGAISSLAAAAPQLTTDVVPLPTTTSDFPTFTGTFTIPTFTIPTATSAAEALQNAASSIASFTTGNNGCGISGFVGSPGMSRNLAALWIRAVFHDGISFDPVTRTGGLDGSVANEFNAHEAFGLRDSLVVSEFDFSNFTGDTLGTDFITSFNTRPYVTVADGIPIAAAASIAACGGPNIAIGLGRETVKKGVQNDVSLIPDDPTVSVATLYLDFFQRLGFTKLEMMILVSGSHTMGGAHRLITPSVTYEDFAPFDDTPDKFDNNIFHKMLNGTCVLPIDCFMAQDVELRPYVEQFAKNERMFFHRYEQAMGKFFKLTGSKLSSAIHFQVQKHDFKADHPELPFTGFPTFTSFPTSTFATFTPEPTVTATAGEF